MGRGRTRRSLAAAGRAGQAGRIEPSRCFVAVVRLIRGLLLGFVRLSGGFVFQAVSSEVCEPSSLWSWRLWGYDRVGPGDFLAVLLTARGDVAVDLLRFRIRNVLVAVVAGVKTGLLRI